MHGDVVAAARVLFGEPIETRHSVFQRLLKQAEWADQYRMASRKLHPFWGDGSLMAASLAQHPPAEPCLDNLEYCRCLALVLDGLANLGRSSHMLKQSGPDQAV